MVVSPSTGSDSPAATSWAPRPSHRVKRHVAGVKWKATDVTPSSFGAMAKRPAASASAGLCGAPSGTGRARMARRPPSDLAHL